ncbi:hypothetical protein GALMADRAFT_566112 [Galerina marginata CBS 339.88]|uniref:Uncharacterized protein n=1 Tax=Galerina marginata (strain CBS 339.88) TaxID=685588 RepID=A0A067SVC9_GALM3|nr:hypothetical protein GALMADRAFT_566112 [Galerina marginata CBS 339.88]
MPVISTFRFATFLAASPMLDKEGSIHRLQLAILLRGPQYATSFSLPTFALSLPLPSPSHFSLNHVTRIIESRGPPMIVVLEEAAGLVNDTSTTLPIPTHVQYIASRIRYSESEEASAAHIRPRSRYCSSHPRANRPSGLSFRLCHLRYSCTWTWSCCQRPFRTRRFFSHGNEDVHDMLPVGVDSHVQMRRTSKSNPPTHGEHFLWEGFDVDLVVDWSCGLLRVLTSPLLLLRYGFGTG